MTCIVGIVDKKNKCVYIGGDSAGVAGYSISIRTDKKVFKKDEFVFGFTSSFRMGQILRYNLSLPKYHPDTDIFEYMVKDVVEAIRGCFDNYGYKKIESNVDSGGTFLVGFKDRLFQIDSDFQVGENVNGYNAVGCGDDIALGSLYTTKIDDDVTTRITKSLEAAAYHSAGVSLPIEIVSNLSE